MIEIGISKEDIERIINKLKQVSPAESGGAVGGVVVRGGVGGVGGGNLAYKAFVEATAYIESKLVMNVTNKILHVRSGRLRDSIGSIVTKEDDNWKGEVGSGVRQGERVPYANIHETGGVITPKRSKFLTIPLGYAKTPAGDARFTARQLFRGMAGHGYKTGVVIGDIIYGVMAQKRQTKIVPLFLLRRSVKIPARYYMSRTADECRGMIAEIMLNTITRGLNA
jgi:phage gpG-like protein